MRPQVIDHVLMALLTGRDVIGQVDINDPDFERKDRAAWDKLIWDALQRDRANQKAREDEPTSG